MNRRSRDSALNRLTTKRLTSDRPFRILSVQAGLFCPHACAIAGLQPALAGGRIRHFGFQIPDLLRPAGNQAGPRQMPNQTLRVSSLILGLLAFAWPAMMLLHESGHIAAAWATGGTVTRIVWHPLVFSRTDVVPNPSPLVVVWAGPVAGCVVPVFGERVLTLTRSSLAYVGQLFCGFCLLANGGYIGFGGFGAIGDAGEMLRLGSPLWLLVIFGLFTWGLGLWYWHLASFRLGFGHSSPKPVPWLHVAYVAGAGVGINVFAFVVGDLRR